MEYVKNMEIGDTVNTVLGTGVVRAYHPVNKMYAIEIPSACGWEWFYADEIEAI